MRRATDRVARRAVDGQVPPARTSRRGHRRAVRDGQLGVERLADHTQRARPHPILSIRCRDRCPLLSRTQLSLPARKLPTRHLPAMATDAARSGCACVRACVRLHPRARARVCVGPWVILHARAVHRDACCVGSDCPRSQHVAGRVTGCNTLCWYNWPWCCNTLYCVAHGMALRHHMLPEQFVSREEYTALPSASRIPRLSSLEYPRVPLSGMRTHSPSPPPAALL